MVASNPTLNISSLKSLFKSRDIALAIGLIILVGLMILPIPAFMLDVLVVLNLALSLGVILLTMYISSPMEFTVFPTFLLLVTLFRMGINIAASRLILLDGDAGNVISAFGSLIVGGNYVVGVVIFLILMIIQFTVINSGAGRVAEVSARFTLDAMPGKQLSIDADLNAGIIDETEARARRKQIETEADFYGAMDGASKFVKGDSIAAIIIMLVNVIGGFVIGVVQGGQTMTEALQAYTLLTVGAGLAVQIPALLISSAAGLIVTRSTSEKSLGTDIFGQLANFNMLAVAAGIIGILSLVPSLPKLPFMAVAVLLGGMAYVVSTTQNKERIARQKPATGTGPVASAEPETPEDMLNMVVVDPMELEIGYSLIPLIDNDASDNLLRRITGIRRQIMAELGLIVPVVRIRDNLRLQPSQYRVKIRGQEVAKGELMLGYMLAIPGSEADPNLKGIATTEPAFGLPAQWITDTEQGRAELMGFTVVNPLSVLSTHLTEIVRGYAPDLLNRQMVQEMLNQLKSRSPASVEGVIPELISLSEFQTILRNLLRERVPIRDLSGILEVVANNAHMTRDPYILGEAVRQTMAQTLSTLYRDETNTLHVFTLDPQLESALRSSLGNTDSGVGFQIDASLAQMIIRKTGDQMEKLAGIGHMPILMCPRELRMAYRRLVEPSLPNLIVLAYSEVSTGTKVKAYGMVDMN